VPKCRGLWLDRGELERLIAAAFSEDERTSGPALTGTRGVGCNDDHDEHQREHDWYRNTGDEHRGPGRRRNWYEIFDID
jgi:uncharacterized protein